MPRGDGTGPMGMGAMSGRAAGFCAGSKRPGYANPAPGRGFGIGRGGWSRGFGEGGRGWRNMFHATGLPGWNRFGGYAAPYGYPAPYQNPDPKMEKQALKRQADALQADLNQLQSRCRLRLPRHGGKRRCRQFF